MSEGPAMARVGIGYDVHPFEADRGPLILGGVEIDHDRGLAGHSDADVLCHAVADALLGAAALGDLGRHFPSSREDLAGISSLVILGQVRDMVAAAGLVPQNIDAVVIAEQPRLGGYLEAMVESLAGCLGLDARRVNVKVTGTDGLGAIGRGEGIAAQAVVCLAPVS